MIGLSSAQQAMPTVSSSSAALDAAYTHCADLVRREDRDRFLATLFVPEAVRRHLLALYAFNIDVARVREVVRDALPGEVRLAWWREVIEGQGRGAVEGHPVALALLDTMARFSLPPSALTNLVDARIFDLYDDPMPSRTDLEGYAGETAGALLQLSLLIVAPEMAAHVGDIAGHGGVALAMTGLMRSFPLHAGRGQCYLPLDMLARHSIGRAEAVSGEVGPGLSATLADMREEAFRHLVQANSAFLALPEQKRLDLAAPLLPLVLVPGDLKALGKVVDPYRDRAGVSAFWRQFVLWSAARRIKAGGGLVRL